MSTYESNTTTTTYTTTYSSDGTSFTNVSSESTHSSTTLYINAVSASQLVASQHFGKQDPYLQFSLSLDKESFQKTFVHKDGGENAVWNQSFTIDLNGQPNLFVEILNQEKTVDEVIGFAAIPINQVVHSQGAYMNGLFDVYDIKGERAGALNLQLAAQGFPNSQKPNFSSETVRGQSFVHEEHKERMNASKNKKTGVAVGAALLGGALAVGAGFLGKKAYDDHKEKEEAEQKEQEEKERHQKEEEEKQAAFESERQRLEAEKAEFENQKRSDESHKEKKECEPKKKECEPKKKECEPKKKECKPKKKECKPKKKNCDDDSGSSSGSDSGSDSDSDNEKKKKKKDCKPKKKSCDSDDEKKHKKKSCDSDDDKKHKKKDCGSDGKNWNPVGTYAAGDKVKYHGKTYVCLQGHTSNPTWTPDAAHSLWQNE
ncbi:hypothetical protein G6F56_002208 [Rhizopus delemar]|uniref:C2 domain-containing protein n=1 Tax=Rhizopus stolonifer TaxID=4846 RepID=A0A367KIF4_RHIST|nr:hypothetical protein G6F56_002208 [Rhizopus delemar]RCI01957.1 hypothetical protein CU098_011244 [Rhizopus stolonifer]